MKLKVRRGDFFRELQRLQSISPPLEKSNPPILSHFLISVERDQLELFATNLDIGYKNTFPAEVHAPGAMTLETRKTFEIFRELPVSGEIEVGEGTKGWAIISAPGVVFRVSTLPSEDFPAAPKHADGGFVPVEAGVIREMIAKTDFAISSDDSMRTLSGALFHAEGDTLLMVATDGHRLAWVRKKGKTEAQLADAIIPRRAVSEIRKLLEELEEEEQVLLKQEDEHLILKSGSIIFYCRLIKGNFPDYNQVIPGEFKTQAIIDRGRFLSALRRVSILSNERSKPIILSLKEEEAELRSNSPEMGEARESVDIRLNGDKVEAGFNARYLMDALGAIREEDVVFDLMDGASASVLKGKGNDEYLCVVMPMRV